MKRKRSDHVPCAAKCAKQDGSFHCRQKRKGVLANPDAKRHHAYNEMKEKERYIAALETTLHQMAARIKELEYQLHMERVQTDRCEYQSSICSY